jgi:hypothetical protein
MLADLRYCLTQTSAIAARWMTKRGTLLAGRPSDRVATDFTATQAVGRGNRGVQSAELRVFDFRCLWR